jgi:hypothetical protein
LYGETEGDTRASILKDFMQLGEDAFEELVPTVTLDSLIPIITTSGKDIILKIDVEGAEWLVFQGAEKFINSFRPVVVFENLPFKTDKANEFLQQNISDFFHEREYEIYLIDEENKILSKIDVINNEKDYLNTNYLAVPTEQRHLFPILIRES